MPPLEFHAEANPSQRLCQEVANLAPTNPFLTWDYVQSRAIGLQAWLFLICHGNRIIAGCPAFLESSFLNRSLEIESLPEVPEPSVFWNGLSEFCQRSRISRLGVYSMSSTSAQIPPLGREISRRVRSEFLIDLRNSDLWKGLRSNHRRRVNRSGRAGVMVERTTNMGAWEEHARAVHNSMERRKTRGETVVEIEKRKSFDTLLQRGRGEIFQAILNGEVLSSVFVIKADRAAYYHWAGTTAAGMNLGASHYLVYQISKCMQEEEMEFFNLGGARQEDAGLVQFKRGFGTIEVSLESAEFCFGNPMISRFGRAIDLFRNDPVSCFKRGMRILADYGSSGQR